MTDIQRRKREHVDLAGHESSQTRRSALWEDVYLLPNSLPEVSIDRVDLSTRFLDHNLGAPVVIAGMTGGHEGAREINANLATAASQLGLAIGLGSQRAALTDPSLIPTYSIVREHAPDALVIGNIGMCQLVPQGDQEPFDEEHIIRAVNMIGADALAVHLNAVEELIQPEGDRNMVGITDAIGRVVEWSPVPVVAKETGAGMTRETAIRLAAKGVAAIDVGGIGGTSFARIEASRAEAERDDRGVRLGEVFGDWGLPTALSVIEAVPAGVPVIATGGIRNGLHVAKAIALGATLTGIGGPLIRAAQRSAESVATELSSILEQLRVAMALTGASSLAALRSKPPVLAGRVADWVAARTLSSVPDRVRT